MIDNQKVEDQYNSEVTIDKNAPIAAYKQLIDIIYAQIKTGVIKPHQIVPSESELGKKYNISRITVRQALRKLTDDGLLYTIKGKGTFVAEQKLDQIMVKIPDFYEDMAQRGLKPDVKVLDLRVIEATQRISEKLQIPLGERVFCIKRLFLADNRPYIIEKKFIVSKDCKILQTCDEKETLNIEDQEIFNVIAGKCHACSEYVDVTIEATTVRSYESKYLEVPTGSLAFYVELIGYRDDETPCGWIASVMRGDLYRFKTRILPYPVIRK